MKNNENTLIECDSCQKSISPLADNCVGCGAPITWVHPKIKEFDDNINSWKTDKPFNYECNKSEMIGNTVPKLSIFEKIIVVFMAISIIIFAFRMPFFLNIIIGAGFGAGIVWYRSKWGVKQWFRVNLQNNEWESSNDVYWKNVKSFFFDENFNITIMTHLSDNEEEFQNKLAGYTQYFKDNGIGEDQSVSFIYSFIYSFTKYRPVPAYCSTMPQFFKVLFPSSFTILASIAIITYLLGNLTISLIAALILSLFGSFVFTYAIYVLIQRFKNKNSLNFHW